MRVLVTGATSFIGRHLVWRLVSMGDDVVGLGDPGSEGVSELREMGVRVAPGDVTDVESIKQAAAGVDVVYHVAGALRATERHSLSDINEQGVANVADACAAQPQPPILVVMSSVAASGPSTGGRPRVESDVPRPVSTYGKSKLAGELQARLRPTVPTTIVRPAVVFGDGDKETLELFRIAERGWHVVPGDGQQRVSLIHVADLAYLLVHAAEFGERISPDNPAQGVYFAAHPEDVTFAEFGRRLGRALGQDTLRVIPTPQAVTWGVAALSELTARVRGRSSLLTREQAKSLAAGAWHCSGTKAIKHLRLKLKMSLDERLDQTVKWYRAEGWLDS